MRNLKVSKFREKIEEMVSRQIDLLMKLSEQHLQSFDGIHFSTFSNDKPYTGALENRIFFTYSNHYHYNNGASMAVGKLNHPHVSYEDRGYIKGVATDLDGYCKLRDANLMSHNIESTLALYRPRFKNSKHKSEYEDKCNSAYEAAMVKLDGFVLTQKKMLNERLKEITRCSLLHYLRSI